MIRAFLSRLGRRPSQPLDEGLLLAERAAVLQIRNRIEVATLGRDARGFRAVDFRPDAVAALHVLAEEQEGIARRLDEQRRSVRGRFGVADSHHDYRRGDLRNLRLRARAAQLLAEALRSRATDPEYLDGLIERARQDAWRDVAGHLKLHLDAAAAPPVSPDAARLERISDLAAELTAALDAQADPLE